MFILRDCKSRGSLADSVPVEGILDHGVTLSYLRHLREEKTKFMTVKYKQHS